MILRIDNDGQRIASTTYWQTEHARRGLMYLSVNAGAVRLLAPAGWPDLESALGARRVTASLQLVGAQAVGVGHVVLEDGSEAPAYLTIDARQMDRTLPASDLGRKVPLLIYVPAADDPAGVRLLASLQARIERAAAAPR